MWRALGVTLPMPQYHWRLFLVAQSCGQSVVVLLGGLADISDRTGYTTIFSATVTILCLATERNRVTNIVFACVKFWRHVE